ncbi:MAG: hypothetical protein K2W85_15760 [Phycisphaerales bacterium]|nr:hypothetical protein [Phycisphaerales bacterium]
MVRSLLLSAAAAGAFASSSFGLVVIGTDPSGLAARAEFTLINSTTLEVKLQNVSTGVPTGFSNSDQILTGVSWAFPAGQEITGGSVVIGAGSKSENFSSGAYFAGDSVSGEWGFGNASQSGLFPNFITTLQAGSTPFGGPNLDGPSNLNGPQGGLVPATPIVALGGLGAISDDIRATLTLSAPLTNLNFLDDKFVRFEFGSDAAFITVPTPTGAIGILCVSGFIMGRRRR